MICQYIRIQEKDLRCMIRVGVKRINITDKFGYEPLMENLYQNLVDELTKEQCISSPMDPE